MFCCVNISLQAVARTLKKINIRRILLIAIESAENFKTICCVAHWLPQQKQGTTVYRSNSGSLGSSRRFIYSRGTPWICQRNIAPASRRWINPSMWRDYATSGASLLCRLHNSLSEQRFTPPRAAGRLWLKWLSTKRTPLLLSTRSILCIFFFWTHRKIYLFRLQNVWVKK